MKYLLLTLLLFSLSGFGEPEVYEGELLESDGLYYKPRSLEPFAGALIGRYHNGQLRFKGTYIDGKKVGLHEGYYENGQLRFKGNYIDGKESGLWELCHKNGQLWEKGNYVDGKKDGLFKYYSEDGVENSWSPQCWQNDKKVDLSICKQ